MHKQLGYLKRGLGYSTKLTTEFELDIGKRTASLMMTLEAVFNERKYRYGVRTHSVKDRIVYVPSSRHIHQKGTNDWRFIKGVVEGIGY